MRRCVFHWLFAGIVGFSAVGCEPRPVVVDPDDGDTTIVEDDPDVQVTPGPTTTTPSGAGVDVSVGDGQGVDVNVNPPATGTGDSANPPANPNATQ